MATATAVAAVGAPSVEGAAEAGCLADWVDHRHFEEIDSTQTFTEREHASFDQGKLTVVSADYQTAGRGTRDRKWVASRAKSVLATFFFRFPAECPTPFVNQNAPNATKVLSVAAVEVLREAAAAAAAGQGDAPCPIEVGVKWPNDVIMSRGKIGGVLAQAVPNGGRIDGVIIGLGLNINTAASDLQQIDRPVWPATSLRVATGDVQDYDVAGIRQRVIWAFARRLRVFFADGFEAFREELNGLDVLMGCVVRFRVGETASFEAVFEGTDENGHILLRRDEEVRSYPAGEILPPMPPPSPASAAAAASVDIE